jgi:CRP-like cAMP-binding protein
MSLVPRSLLKQYGGKLLQVRKGDSIFREGEPAHFFYQVDEGQVKMITSSQDGREFIQGVFNKGESFGEPPLFCGVYYPATAYCMERSSIYRLEKDRFFDLLHDHFDIHLRLNKVLCSRLRYKNVMLNEVAFYEPEHRLAKFFETFARQAGEPAAELVIPYTRQELADLTGMRVETAIRTIKKLERAGKVALRGRKIVIASAR